MRRIPKFATRNPKLWCQGWEKPNNKMNGNEHFRDLKQQQAATSGAEKRSQHQSARNCSSLSGHLKLAPKWIDHKSIVLSSPALQEKLTWVTDWFWSLQQMSPPVTTGRVAEIPLSPSPHATSCQLSFTSTNSSHRTRPLDCNYVIMAGCKRESIPIDSDVKMPNFTALKSLFTAWCKKLSWALDSPKWACSATFIWSMFCIALSQECACITLVI